MKLKYVVIMVILLSFFAYSKSEDELPKLISSEEAWKDKKSGRIVTLEEVMRIHDNGRNIIFKNPRYLSHLDDGSVIFFDYPSLYRYDKNGKLIFKILKQGEGPGECLQPDYYYFDGDRIYVHSWIPPKILEYEINGKYIREKKVPSHVFVYIGYVDNRIFGIRDEIRYSEFIHKEGFFKTPFTLYKIIPNFRKLEKIFEIPVKHYIKKAHWWRRAMFAVVPFEHYLFIVHTEKYQIAKLDLRSGRIEKVFKRPYDRLKSREEETEQDIYHPVPKNLLPPPSDHVFDIWWIQIANNSLWVFTSTTKDENELIDIFDMEGNYIDCFYLQFPVNNEYHNPFNTMISDDGFLFIPEENKDTGFVSIGKYKIKADLSYSK